MDCDREDLKERLVERLYGVEAKDGPSPDVLQRHLESCPDCREELEALRALRRDLSAWREPEPRALWRWGVAASWAGPGFWRLAAAAVLVLALGGAVGLSGLSFHFERGPFQVTLGRGPTVSRAALAEQVQLMLAESEARQLAAMDAGWREFVARAESQRRYDLARVSEGLSYLDRRTGEHATRTTELVGYLLEASAER